MLFDDAERFFQPVGFHTDHERRVSAAQKTTRAGNPRDADAALHQRVCERFLVVVLNNGKQQFHTYSSGLVLLRKDKKYASMNSIQYFARF